MKERNNAIILNKAIIYYNIGIFIIDFYFNLAKPGKFEVETEANLEQYIHKYNTYTIDKKPIRFVINIRNIILFVHKQWKEV